MSSYEYNEEDDEYSYNDEENSENSQENMTLTKPPAQQSRIQFEQQGPIQLALGPTGHVQVNPGPNKSFQIMFSVKEEGHEHRLALNITDGVCSINVMGEPGVVQQMPVPQPLPEPPAKRPTSIVYDQIYKRVE